MEAQIDDNRDKLATRRQALFQDEKEPDLSEFQEKLKVLPLEDLQSLAKEIADLLEKPETSRLSRPHIDAVISELQLRTKDLKKESESLRQQLAEEEQRAAERKQECNRLKHEVHHLQQKAEYEEFRANRIQTTGSFTPRRNDPCPCGSGKKYKHCCGK